MKQTSDLKIHPSVTYIKGTIPVLLSAPHVHRHKRPNLMGKFKVGEEHTDYIVRNLCEATGSHGLILTQPVDYDPNWHPIEKNPYKKLADEIMKSEKIEYFYDFHGLSDRYNFDLGVYYLPRFRRSKEKAYELAQTLNNGHLRELLISMHKFLDNDQETLTEYLLNEYKVAGAQFELARYIRRDGVLLEEFIRLTTQFIKSL